MRQRSSAPVALLAAALAAAAPAAPAAAQTFDFESVPVGTTTPFPQTAGGVFAGFSTSLGPPNAFAVQASTFVTLGGRVLQQSAGASGGLSVQFLGSAINAVSLRFATFGPATLTMEVLTPFASPIGSIGVVAATVTAAGTVPAGGTNPEGVISYAGLPIYGIRLTAPARFAIDDLRVTQSAVVPEPGSAALVAAGLAGVGAAARRRRRAG